jgi:hypothetical protein
MSIVNDKPTPETDEQFKSFPAYFEIDLFCRKLERERDEAREALEYIAYSNRSALHIEDYAKEFLARIVSC